VVSTNDLASEVGAEVMRDGGNAVDAAIATGFALAVTHPTAGNIGGGGFIVIRFPDGHVTGFDFREKAPLAAKPEMFLDSSGQYSAQRHHEGYLSVGVPGSVAGFALAHSRYAKLPWSRLLAPAVRLARDGFVIGPVLASDLARQLARFKLYPATLQAFSKNGVAYAVGDTLRQPDLARTLERIQRHGRDGFYRGETARLLADEMRRNGGLITEEDLARYEAKERVPLRGTYRGYEVISMAPPSSGGAALLEMLNILEGYDLRSMGHNSTAYIHHLTEAMRLAFRDRALYLADPDYVKVPIEKLTSKAYAAELRKAIREDRATPSRVADVQQVPEGTHTTHYSVVDGDGMAASVTVTLENAYGSKITVPGAGFLLNDEMGDFNEQPGVTTADGMIGTSANLARPGQRMLSNMTPTIVARDGKLVAVIGTPGGRTIITTVLQLVLNLIDFGFDPERVIAAPRIHHQWLPDHLTIETDGVDSVTAGQLRALGHDVTVRGRQGAAHSIMIDWRTSQLVAVPDRRNRNAAAAGF
jgi:gamma-glutamyltranspeptidase/glutathione hydrolase